MSSTWRKYITQPGRTRVVSLDATELARELVAIQGLAPAAQPGLADAVVAGLLIASSHKSNESINVNAKGSGLFRQAIVDASPEGRARGFLITNDGAAPSWGNGVLSVLYTKNFEGKTPYTGLVAITDGSLETAVNEYYRDSEQLASRVGLDVGREGDRLIARGVLVQALGGASDEERARIEALDPADLRALARHAADADFAARARPLLGDLVETESRELASFCTCGVERIERALLLTGEADTREALGTDPHLTITCDFCRREYTVTAERITTLFSRDPSRLQ